MVTAMAIVIEFYVPDRFRKQSGKWIPPERRAKIIPFPAPEKSQHEMKASAQPHAPADPLVRKAIRELQWTRLIRCSTATRNSITGKKKTMTSDRMLSDSTVTTIMHVPLEKVNIAEWLLTLPDAEHQRCSHAHIAAGTSTTDNSRTMSINVESIGDALRAALCGRSEGTYALPHGVDIGPDQQERTHQSEGGVDAQRAKT
jgi:hypothetical protein